MTPERLGPYKIEKLLGQGGMGSVYLGTHQETEQQAAVKVLSSSLSSDDDFRVRFAGEIESLKKLKHPNIVQLLGWGEQDASLFYAMEFVDGSSLQDHLAQGERVEWREAIQIGIDVCRALKHAHDSGIIHRDLKPANLLQDSEVRIKLTDFGIAKLFGYTQLTVEGGVVGTADYMAPEQALGQPVNHRCDLYSLGSVLFTLLAGRPPFLAKSMPEVVHKVCYEPPQPVRRFNASVPPQLESLIGELLEKDPKKRPPTARALTTRLEAMQHGLTESRKILDSDDARHSTDFDYSEPGQTIVPDPPRVHSATTRFAVDDGDSPVAGADSSERTGLPSRDVTSGGSTAATGSGSPTPKASSEPSNASSTFTTVEEDARVALSQPGDQATQRWIIGLMAVALTAIIAFVIWQVVVPPGADAIYDGIQSVASDETADLSSASRDIERFLKLYPADPRADEVRELAEEIELERMQRSLERRARAKLSGTSNSPIERAYLEAVELSRTQPQQAIDRFEALVDVFGGQQDATSRTKDIVALAERQIEDLQLQIAAEREAFSEQLHQRLLAAEQLEADRPADARAIYQGIVLLYENKPWAVEIVASAKTRLANLNAAAE